MRRRAVWLVLAFLCAGLTTAQEEPESVEIWSGSLGLSLLAATGNSDTTSFGLDFDVHREPTPWGVELKTNLHRADEEGTVTAERYFASARAVRNWTVRWGLFGGGSAEADKLSGLELRLLGETGVTFKALVGPGHQLSFDLGLTWTDENRVEPEADESSLGGVAGVAYAWQISETASFTQLVAFHPSFEQPSDWRLSSETALQAQIHQRWAMKLSYEVRFRNEPIGENEDTDTTLKASVVLSL